MMNQGGFHNSQIEQVTELKRTLNLYLNRLMVATLSLAVVAVIFLTVPYLFQRTGYIFLLCYCSSTCCELIYVAFIFQLTREGIDPPVFQHRASTIVHQRPLIFGGPPRTTDPRIGEGAAHVGDGNCGPERRPIEVTEELVTRWIEGVPMKKTVMRARGDYDEVGSPVERGSATSLLPMMVISPRTQQSALASRSAFTDHLRLQPNQVAAPQLPEWDP
jgi:hypothetical protein